MISNCCDLLRQEVDKELDMGCQLLTRIFRVEIAGVFLAVVLWQHPDITFRPEYQRKVDKEMS